MTSKKAKFTPGDWLIDGTTVYALNADCTNRFSAGVQKGWVHQSDEKTSDDEVLANARLMAAAPELLSLLRKYAYAASFPYGDPLHQAYLKDADKAGRALIARVEDE